MNHHLLRPDSASSIGPWTALVFRLAAATTVAALVAVTSPIVAAADAQGKNACGCRQDSAGNCSCERDARCGCPGECEPKGCADKREKELRREVELEEKKARGEMTKQSTAPSKSPGIAKPETAEGEKKHERPAPHHLTAQQSRELARLLKLYLEEHPEDRQETIEATRAKLGR